MKYEEQVFTVSIKDNGKGFDPALLNENNTSGNGLGIRNMNNRARLIGADFKMSSVLMKGTEIIVTLPVNVFNK